jgi:Nuclease subunit of the excinuclease complex
MEFNNCVYRFKNINDEIIYIGKAKNLKNRLANHNHLSKQCYEELEKIDFATFETEADMYLAEKYYISKIKPKYNHMHKEKEVTFFIEQLENIKWLLSNYRTKLYDGNGKYYGETGKRTNIVDIDGNKLYTGDVVNLYNYDIYDKDLAYRRQATIVNDRIFGYSVMGLVGTNFENGRDKSRLLGISIGWEIKLSKRYDEMKYGDEVEAIRYK